MINWEAVDISILGPALLAGLVVLSTHVPLGQRVLERGIIFIDLAIAQLAGLGVIATYSLQHDASDYTVQIAAFTAALLGASLFYWTERRWPKLQEAIIGCVFVLSATAAILFLAKDPHGGEHLKDLLVGQILWIDISSLVFPAILSALVLGLWIVLKKSRSHGPFYLLFAISITTAVQLVGVYLVFATLIIPALAGRFLPLRMRLAAGYVIAVSGYFFGLLLSAMFDLPAGPLIVWTLATGAVFVAVVRSKFFRTSA